MKDYTIQHQFQFSTIQSDSPAENRINKKGQCFHQPLKDFILFFKLRIRNMHAVR